jgi:UDP-N-acetylmuramoyl-tripeptide--D-alanyl-D-alanine ligase
MEMLTRSDGIIVINDAYNASPEPDVGRAQDARRDHRTRPAFHRGPRRDEPELGELDEEHDRIARLVVRLNIQKLIIVVGHGARHIHNAGLGRFLGREVGCSVATDEAYLCRSARGRHRAGEVA